MDKTLPLKPLNRVPAKVSDTLIKLLQGFVYSSDKQHWNTLLTYEAVVRDFGLNIHLHLHLNQEEGYAFFSHSRRDGLDDDESDAWQNEDTTPDAEESRGASLVRRIPLSFEVSLLCVLLRESLEQFDVGRSDDHRLILTRDELHDLLQMFYPERSDQIKQQRKFDSTINKVVDLGFLRPLSTDSHRFEVKRTLKALVDASVLREMKELMMKELGINQPVEARS